METEDEESRAATKRRQAFTHLQLHHYQGQYLRRHLAFCFPMVPLSAPSLPSTLSLGHLLPPGSLGQSGDAEEALLRTAEKVNWALMLKVLDVLLCASSLFQFLLFQVSLASKFAQSPSTLAKISISASVVSLFWVLVSLLEAQGLVKFCSGWSIFLSLGFGYWYT